MSLLVVALLSLLWLGFFLPSLLQARRTSSPYASATTFQDSLRRLGEVPYPKPPGPGEPLAVPRATAVQARRRETLVVLSAAVVAGGLIAVGFGGWAVWAVVPPVIALTAYVVMLRREVLRRAAARGARPHLSAEAPADLPAVVDAEPRSAPVPVPEAVEGVAGDLEIVPSVARRSSLPPSERMAG